MYVCVYVGVGVPLGRLARAASEFRNLAKFKTVLCAADRLEFVANDSQFSTRDFWLVGQRSVRGMATGHACLPARGRRTIHSHTYAHTHY